MTIFDYVVVGVFFISVILSIIRGLVREVLSIAGWVVAFIAASTFTHDLEPYMPPEIGGESLRLISAFILVFIVTLIVSVLITTLMNTLIKNVGLGFIDRILGAFFGFARALIIIMTLVLIAGLTALPQQPLWHQAVLSPSMEAMAEQVLPWLPDDLSKRISFERKDEIIQQSN
ncbi:membrane protein required for colicin V production [Nitrosomonas aestuarii]|uniref:Membrane protein required for colicin V production n=1 Tax=Nitrosomonas aestuarii TaxID=52441 RepID=A0A1I3YK19_9PROT|nr:CvpA family protein [Nitrosomonas aestuarii]SFK32228.1 membrane protein required for colicin V production [Nitrosomonas aestuarii]